MAFSPVIPAVAWFVLACGTGCFLSCAPRESEDKDGRWPDPRVREDVGDYHEVDLTPPDAGPSSSPESPVFSTSCSGFTTRARVPKEPASHCAGPARDPLTSVRDRAAARKIEEVLTTNYIASEGDLERRFELLVAISRACETHCTAPTQARIWMYMGVFYGSAFRRYDDARCAFDVALAWDPRVALDLAVCTPQTEAAFVAARKGRCRD